MVKIKISKKEQSEQKFSIRIHEAYRKVVAMCDAELLGKRFEKGTLQLEVNETFYGGKGSKIVNEKQALRILKHEILDDSCFNFVGKNTIELAAKANIIDKKRVIKIQGIPHALALI